MARAAIIIIIIFVFHLASGAREHRRRLSAAKAMRVRFAHLAYALHTISRVCLCTYYYYYLYTLLYKVYNVPAVHIKFSLLYLYIIIILSATSISRSATVIVVVFVDIIMSCTRGVQLWRRGRRGSGGVAVERGREGGEKPRERKMLDKFSLARDNVRAYIILSVRIKPGII